MAVYLDFDEDGSDWIKGKRWSMRYIDYESGESRPVTTADQMLAALGATIAPPWLARMKVEGFMELRASDAMPDSIFEELVEKGLIQS